MRVNDQKMALLCVSAAVSYEARAVLYGRNQELIRSQDTIKLLGYTVDVDGGCGTHVNNMVRKMRSKTWALGRLKKYGFDDRDLVNVYITYIRPIAEYVSVVWHSLLNADQAAKIEHQQTRALRHIYGYGISARRMRELAAVELFSKRRRDACLSFARKASSSPRFAHWFTMRPPSGYPRRRRSIFHEPTARTDRYRNSALNYMKRLLNE